MDRVAVFARYPRIGQVKTRLSPAISPALALELHTAMLMDALECAREAGAGPLILYWAAGSGEPVGGFPISRGIETRTQRGDDLGERLCAAFADLLSDPGDRAVVIGADCPDLTPDLVRDAFGALGRHDLILGPADDGGYYLIGLRRHVPALFRGVPWGTGSVLAQTLERAKEAGVEVVTLGALGDIDTPEDLIGFVARRCFTSPGPGARTEAALREMGLLPPGT